MKVDPVAGARFEGDVLTGKLTVAEAIWCDARRAVRPADGPVAPQPEGYDPVLRHHLRVVKP